MSMKTHHIIIYEKSIIESNNETINNLLNVLHNFGYIDDTINFDNIDKKYLYIDPVIRINENDVDFLSEIKTYQKKSYNITMKYMDLEEIIFTTKRINFEQKYVYLPTIHNINVTLNNNIVELKIEIKYNLKKDIKG